MQLGIPKRLGHIWIGPKPAPTTWMQSWKDKHPEWDYRLYDNDFLMEFPFRNRLLINEYFWRAEYAGVQDLMRYEILYEYGGFMADADAICRHPVDGLLERTGAYTVYDRDVEEGRGVSPFLASEPKNPLLGEVIDRLSTLKPWELRKPFHSTGNLFLMSLIRKWGEDKLTIFPSHYFIPWHHGTPDKVYDGPDTIYAEQMWGTATFRYNRGEGEGDEALARRHVAENAATLRLSLTRQVQPQLKPATTGTKSFDGRAVNALLDSRVWQDQLQALNTHVGAALAAAGEPERINANGFYRPMQTRPMNETGLMTRSARLRIRVLDWLTRVQSVLQVGVDCGHMLLAHRLLQPWAQIYAFDTKTRTNPHGARNDIYTPAAMEWFAKTFPETCPTFIDGRPLRALSGFHQRTPDASVDMIHFNGVDDNFLKAYGGARGMLVPQGLILIQDMEPERVRSHIERLQMIDEVAEPIEIADFGLGRGALAVLRAKR